MKRVLALLALTTCAGTAADFAYAAESFPKADLAKGQSLASGTCSACHGGDGNSAIATNPKLAAQIPEYLQKQLLDFKPTAGKKAARENPIMAGMAGPLSADDIRNVAAFYSAQALKLGAARNKDSVELGRKIWRGGDASRGVPACAACHGATGAGVPSQYPRLAGQHPEYTTAQLKAFHSGARANDANKIMRSIAEKLTDEEMQAVADYAAGLH